MLTITIVILVSYLIGSIPSAYLIGRFFGGVDLRVEGSRNIGARNIYDVTGQKKFGLIVAAFDFLKGAAPVLLLNAFGDVAAMMGVAVVLGHCYPIWLRFHGGRGLATGSAVILLLSPIQLLVWVAAYFISSIIRKQVNVQSLLATLACVVFELVTDTSMIARSITPIQGSGNGITHYSLLLIFAIIISRHIEPVRTYLKTSS